MNKLLCELGLVTKFKRWLQFVWVIVIVIITLFVLLSCVKPGLLRQLLEECCRESKFVSTHAYSLRNVPLELQTEVK